MGRGMLSGLATGRATAVMWSGRGRRRHPPGDECELLRRGGGRGAVFYHNFGADSGGFAAPLRHPHAVAQVETYSVSSRLGQCRDVMHLIHVMLGLGLGLG